MYVALVDAKFLNSKELNDVFKEYIELFGKDTLPMFNYADFQRQGDKCSAEIYKEALEKCIAEGKPYDIPSRWVDPYEEYFKSLEEKEDKK